MILTVTEAAEELAGRLHGDDCAPLLFAATALEIEERLEEAILSGKVRPRLRKTGMFDDSQAFMGIKALVLLDDAVAYLAGEGLDFASSKTAATSGAPDSSTPEGEQFTVRGINGISTMSREEYDDYQQSLEIRRAAGRYRLEEAAVMIEPEAVRAINLQKELVKAVRNCALPVYEPGRDLRWRCETVRADYEEARWCDLNAWLADNEPQSGFKFPAPSGAPEKAEMPVSHPLVVATTTRHLIRTNSLDTPIQKAIKQAGSLDTGAVFVALRELAISEEKPFTGVVEGDALCYTNDDNEPAKLSKGALRKRLKKHSM